MENHAKERLVQRFNLPDSEMGKIKELATNPDTYEIVKVQNDGSELRVIQYKNRKITCVMKKEFIVTMYAAVMKQPVGLKLLTEARREIKELEKSNRRIGEMQKARKIIEEDLFKYKSVFFGKNVFKVIIRSIKMWKANK